MSVYSVRGRSSATTAATADHGLFALWNPSTDNKLKVLEFGYHHSGGVSISQHIVLQRITARGTPGTTQTPDIDSNWEHAEAPPSGALFDMAVYTVQPTFADPPLMGWQPSLASGLSPFWGWVWSNPAGIVVKPGTGLAVKQIEAQIHPIVEPYVVWEEDGAF